MKNKLKLSLIAIATLVAGNVNAQTYYSCIPEGCPAGQYFDGKKCLPVENLLSTQCPPGYIFSYNACCKNEPYYVSILVSTEQKEPPISNRGVVFTTSDNNSYQNSYSAKLYPGDYVDYLYTNAGPLLTRRTYVDCSTYHYSTYNLK